MARDFQMFFGAASGAQRKTLQQMEEPNVMISYATRDNYPWDGIKTLFIDSGGYSNMIAGYDHDPLHQYFDYLEKHEPEIFALQDYPCEPDVLEKRGTTVEEHQQLTTKAAMDALNRLPNRNLRGDPLVVLQGWETEDYLRHLDTLRSQGCLTRYVGLGSVCRRNATDDLREIILTVRDELPSSHKIHGFGIKGKVLEYPEVREALASADSLAYDYHVGHEWAEIPEKLPYWHPSAAGYLSMKRKIQELLDNDRDESSDNQQKLTNFETA